MSVKTTKSFKSRIFGGDIPMQIKKKLESRQILAKKATDPNQPFESKFTDLRSENYTHEELNKQNFNGIADLSSRTPIARMWTAVKVAEDTITKENLTDEELKEIQLEKDEFVENKSLHKWDYIDNTTKVYVVGNHTLNTLQKSPNSSITQNVTNGNDVRITADVMRALTPGEQETDFNEMLKPPAGITSINSETEGPMGILRKTTIEFQVHNFSDFERIYMRYFLRPGAQIFIDYGWDTAPLYQPKDLLESESTVEEYLWGDKGIITNSGGDMETSIGHVSDYSATVRSDGGFDCSVEIISKNGVILQSTVDDAFKKRVEWGLDTELLGLAVAHETGNKKFYDKAKAWGGDDNQLGVQDKTELEQAYRLAASTIIGGNEILLPGLNYGTETKRAELTMELGVYFGGVNDNNYQIFINLGFLEDQILNKELGFSDTKEDLVNSNVSTTKNADEGSLKAKFNSRNSFIHWNQNLRQGMLDREGYKEVDMLYPHNWGWTHKTYNTIRGMVPDDRIDDIDPLTKKYTKNWEKEDRDNKRIPAREVFVRLEMVKDVIENSNTVPDILRQICERINSSTGNIVDLTAGSNAYAANTISIMDKNVIAAVDINEFINSNEPTNPKSTTRQAFLDELFTFSPYSPDSLVKEYSLDFSMPDGAMGNMIAVQGSSTNHARAQSISNVLAGLVAMEETERFGEQESKNLHVKWIPKVGEHAAQRLHENLQYGSTKTFDFDAGDAVFNEAIDRGASYNMLFEDRTKAGLENNESGNQYLQTMIKNAIQPGVDIYGEEVTNPTESTKEELDEDAEEKARRNNEEVTSSVYKYWVTEARREHANSILPLIEAKLTLKIYGVAGLKPGDLFRVDYLPQQYFQTCFFQIISVKDDISADGWGTEIEGQMRLLPSLRPIGLSAAAPKPVVALSSVISSIGADDAGEQKALNHNLKFLSNGTPLKLNEIFGEGNTPEHLTKAVMCEFTSDGKAHTDAEDNYYVWLEFNLLKDYNYQKGFGASDSSTSSGATPSDKGFIYNFNKNGDGISTNKVGIGEAGYLYKRYASKEGNQGHEGKGIVRIDDFDLTWSTSSGLSSMARNYFYRGYFERGKFKKGDKIMIVCSKKGNWLFVPPNVKLLKEHGLQMSWLFKDCKETWD